MKLGELSWPVRAAFYVALLACVAAADLLFDDVLAPLAVVVVFLFVALPLVARSFGRPKDSLPHASNRAVIGFAAVLTLLTAVEVAVVPDFGLGAVFWIVAILIPSVEVLGYLTRREASTST
jgi:hypothetical protein